MMRPLIPGASSLRLRLPPGRFWLSWESRSNCCTAPFKKKKEGVAAQPKATDLNYEINYVSFSGKPEFEILCREMDKIVTKDPKEREQKLNAIILTAFRLQNTEEARKGASPWENFWNKVELENDDVNHSKKQALKQYAEECICFAIGLNIKQTINYSNLKPVEEEKKSKRKTINWVRSHTAIFEGNKKEKPKNFSTSSPESSGHLKKKK